MTAIYINFKISAITSVKMANDSAKTIAKIMVVLTLFSASGLRPKASTAFPPILPIARAGPKTPILMVNAVAINCIDSGDIFVTPPFNYENFNDAILLN